MNKPIEATLVGGFAVLLVLLFAFICVLIEKSWKWLKKLHTRNTKTL
jgi:hypothetical protein